MNKEPVTLAIDTSCDETSVSVVRGFSILSNIQPSQMKYHKKFGGVVPSLAKFAHQERIDNVVKEAVEKSGLGWKDIDAVAVTIGPGLAIALEVGIIKAKELAETYRKPLITVNHMEGHLLSALAERSSNLKIQSSKKIPDSNKIRNTKSGLPTEAQSAQAGDPKIRFHNKLEIIQNKNLPALGFLISGGHTELVLVKDFGDYEIVGKTLDDSAGEAYDKCGRIIGLGYPAGPVITEFAKRHRRNIEFHSENQNKSIKLIGKNTVSGAEYSLPISMAKSGDLNMSYSGLKTAFKELVENLAGGSITVEDQMSKNTKGLNKDQIMDLCVLFEETAIRQLEIKLESAIGKYKPKQIWLGGGVIASPRLRSKLRNIGKKYKIETIFPYSKKLTTDNAAMIGIAANLKLARNIESKNQNLDILTENFDSIDRKPNLSL